MIFLAVAESAAVAVHHEVKGEAAYCFVTLRDGFEFSDSLVSELKLKGKRMNISERKIQWIGLFNILPFILQFEKKSVLSLHLKPYNWRQLYPKQGQGKLCDEY